MEELLAKYPDMAPHLEALPPHLIDHLGEMVVSMTHEDMHPKKEVKGEYGQTVLAADLTHVITDPVYDASQLEQGAVDAAQAGQEKVSGLLLETSKLLGQSQASLTEKGVTFGAKALETDDQRSTREMQERDMVYGSATTHALNRAIEAKRQGDEAATTTALETLVLLHHLKGSEDRKDLRGTVRAGLGEELLAATQAAAKLHTKGYDTVGLSMYDAKDLLEMTTGKSLNGNFDVRGEKQEFGGVLVGEEAIKDAMAVMTSPYGLSLEQGLASFANSTTIMIKLKERMQANAGNPAAYTPDYYYQVVEDAPTLSDVSDALECSDPMQAVTTARELGMTVNQALYLFGRSESQNELKTLDSKTVSEMTELKKAYPDEYQTIVDNYATGATHKDGGIAYEPSAIKHGLDRLKEAGVDDANILLEMVRVSNASSVAESSILLDAVCKKSGFDLKTGREMAQATNTSWSELRANVAEYPDQSAEIINKLVTSAEIVAAYTEHYHKFRFPLEPPPPEKPGLSEIPAVKERISKLGLPEAVAENMFNSWNTYKAFTKYYYKNDEFHIPTELPNPAALKGIAVDQAKAIENQLSHLETFTAQYGVEVRDQIVATFGIYNFARYDPAKLVHQNELWQAGGKIDSVVVHARNDWNSFTKHTVQFPPEEGEGVFDFEANSGLEVARIAVLAGRQERAHGRQPDIQKFIINAHGDPDGMSMGVDGESIDTSMYLEAARQAAKIGAREVNDYKRHLGPNFKVILQACSTAGENNGTKNIAETMSERHGAEVAGSDVTIHGLQIMDDGTVHFKVGIGDGRPIVYNA